MLDELAGIQTVEVILATHCGRRICKHCGSKPAEHQATPRHKLGRTPPRSPEAVDL